MPHSLHTGLSPLMQFPGFPCNSLNFQQQVWIELLSLPFRPGPGTARGRAAASPGDKESHTAPGHILNSSIVRQEEMCLGNAAVTTLKHHNSILTTSLRRCRSDKQAERGSRALPAAAPAGSGAFGAGRASRSLLRGCVTRLNREHTAPGGILHFSLPLLRHSGQGNPCTQRAEPASRPCEGTLIHTEPRPDPTPSFPRAPPEHGEHCSPWLSCCHPSRALPSPHARDGSEEELPGSLLWNHPSPAIQHQPHSGHQCLGQNHTLLLHLATDWKPLSYCLLPGKVLFPYLRHSSALSTLSH